MDCLRRSERVEFDLLYEIHVEGKTFERKYYRKNMEGGHIDRSLLSFYVKLY